MSIESQQLSLCFCSCHCYSTDCIGLTEHLASSSAKKCWISCADQSIGSCEVRTVPISASLLHPQVPKGLAYGTEKGSGSLPLSTQQT